MATHEETAADLTTKLLVAALGAGEQSQVSLQADRNAEAAAKNLSNMFNIVYETVLKKIED
jgi:hypothetical protein